MRFVPNFDIQPEALAEKIYACLEWWGTFDEPESDSAQEYYRWDDLVEMAEAIMDPNWKNPIR